MGFKSDREFLRNVSIGAVGTRKVASILRAAGFRIIELERYSRSNKIWATKIKRLRVPDLLCLRTGIRIESRAKSTLKITMSHAINNRDRAWDRGLRNDDLVAFIHCTNVDDTWVASDRLALFRVNNMRSTAELAGLSRMKAASEGSEIQLTWPATVPSRAGRVTGVTESAIETILDSGRRQTYRLTRKNRGGIEYSLTPYVAIGHRFGDGDAILASVVPQIVEPQCRVDKQYDFYADLDHSERETIYAAVKAIGYLPELRDDCEGRLVSIMETHEDDFVKLEAAATLARLDVDEGWLKIVDVARSPNVPVEMRMETALILAEQQMPRSAEILAEIAEDRNNESELRAAGAWGLSQISYPAAGSRLLDLIDDPDEVTAVHAIAGMSRLLDKGNLQIVLNELGTTDRRSAGIVRAILASGLDFISEVVAGVRLATGKQRLWMLYLLACAGREKAGPHIRESAPDLIDELEFFWTLHVDNWTNRLDVADQIDFLLAQILDR